jgi:hypothetical protein
MVEPLQRIFEHAFVAQPAVPHNRLNFTGVANSNGQSSVTNHAPQAGEQAVYKSTDTVAYAVVAYLPKADGSGDILLIGGEPRQRLPRRAEIFCSPKINCPHFRKGCTSTSSPISTLCSG